MPKGTKIKTLLTLQLLFFIYSLGGIFSKYAANSGICSLQFFIFYGLVLLDMIVYAVIWQQVLRHVPLVTAYANKATTTIWGLLWGIFLFDEAVSLKKVLGIIIIVAGIILVVTSDENK